MEFEQLRGVWDLGVFGKMKCLFSIASDARTGGKVTEVIGAKK
jgi:hypothetical protein